MKQIWAVVLLVFVSEFVMATDIDSLWDFQDPQRSEQRFKSALADSTGDESLIIQTQIARTYSMRGDYESARRVLSQLDASLNTSSVEVRVRYALELGRTYASARHSEESLNAEALELARSLYLDAYESAQTAKLDGLAIDALHMMAFVDTKPEEQLHWAQQALAVVSSSDQASAKKWQASLLNNAGYALHRLGRYEEALVEFEKAVELREQESDAWATHVAHWMVAWTLRALGRPDEAIEIQLRLEREREVEGDPDAPVFEELASLYEMLGNTERASLYTEKARALSP